MRNPAALKSPVLRAGLTLAAFALLASTLLASVHSCTAARIAEQVQREALIKLEQVVPPTLYSNDLLASGIALPADTLGYRKPHTAYVARNSRGEAVAVALPVRATDGYNGNIDLLVGIDIHGMILGVRVVRHKETPGLGDAIELRRTSWLLGFNGRSLDNTPRQRWAVKRDGGRFDQFTGATITPRAVVGAVARSLQYFKDHCKQLLSRS